MSDYHLRSRELLLRQRVLRLDLPELSGVHRHTGCQLTRTALLALTIEHGHSVTYNPW